MNAKRPTFTRHSRGLIFEYWPLPSDERFITCMREDGGICGLGDTDEEAEADLRSKEAEIWHKPDVDRQVDDALHDEAFPNE